MNKIKDKIFKLLGNDTKKIKIVVTVGLIGMVLILGSEFISNDSSNHDEKSDTNSISYQEYTENLENKLVSVISAIDGVGECKVMITLENTTESVYATNYENKYDDDSNNSKGEYVFYDSSNGESPVLIKEYMPVVQGVTVVCTGGDNIVTKEKIIDAVTSLFNISTNRVSVSKIKS
ncbi:MAG: hypothetical protein NC397_02920 [Clostridium sp.]|nr:hypothetical protein [Clostridium sp.]